MLRPTEASSALDPDQEDSDDPLLGSKVPFKPLHGYSAAELYRDPRFKLTDALARQGLHQTLAGRQAIALAQTAKPTRPDNLTSAQRDYSGSHR